MVIRRAREEINRGARQSSGAMIYGDVYPREEKEQLLCVCV